MKHWSSHQGSYIWNLLTHQACRRGSFSVKVVGCYFWILSHQITLWSVILENRYQYLGLNIFFLLFWWVHWTFSSWRERNIHKFHFNSIITQNETMVISKTYTWRQTKLKCGLIVLANRTSELPNPNYDEHQRPKKKEKKKRITSWSK